MTVRSMIFVLPEGTVIDTAAEDAERTFAKAAPELAAGLTLLREEILADPDLVARLRHKYAIKNTNGYRLVAFLDGETPLEIFRRLLVGSEGTLGFIAEVVFDTIALGPVHSTALLIFPTLDAAADVVPAFVAAGARGGDDGRCHPATVRGQSSRPAVVGSAARRGGRASGGVPGSQQR